ncbi:MAG TPA: serine/threonine-protein kinase [Gemmatimonadaceae bacterium]|nr:serine/threonine-protein kinase [Gemmatimonadaceae bacterium]
MSAELRSILERSLGDGMRLGRELGAGMAKVFLAEDVVHGRQFVVKMLSADLAAGVDLERFRREIQLASRLHHPRIVPLLNAGEADGSLYFTMPYIDGDSLRLVMEREKQLPLERAMAITRDVAEALEYAHAQNIVHRDIKPDNILLDRTSGRAVVTDFGIARAIERAADISSVTSTGLTLGTPTYMSPEQAAAEKHIDGRSDIYSLGCVLYEMLTGTPLFSGSTARAIIARHLNEPPPPVRVVRPDVPEATERAIKRMLAKDPAARFKSARQLIETIDQPSTELPQPRRVRPWRRRAVVGALVAAVAMLGATLARKSRLGPWSARSADPTRIAVLYVGAPAADTVLTTIARGLTRDLIYALARVPDLHIISEAGIRRFGPYAAPDSVALALGTGTVITGTLDRVADSLQLDLRLVDAGSLVERSAVRGRYDLTTPVTMRDSVVRAVARELLRRIGRDAQTFAWRSETRSTRAWELRQRARDMVEYAADLPTRPTDFTPQLNVLVSAESLLTLASAADASWEEPVVERAWAQVRRSRLLPEARQASLLDSTMALSRLDQTRWPGSARGLELRGVIEAERWKNVPGVPPILGDSAEADLRAATASDGQLARAWNTLSDVLNRKGDSAGSVLAGRRALEVDGYERDAGRTMMMLMFRSLFDRQGDSARSQCVRARTRFPRDSYVQSCELTVLGWYGSGAQDVVATWRALGQTERSGVFPLVADMFPSGRFWVASVLARTGLSDSARAVMARTRARLRSTGHEGEFGMNEAQVRTILGENEVAIALLEGTVTRDPAKRSVIRALPWFDRLHGTPRFDRLIRTD